MAGVARVHRGALGQPHGSTVLGVNVNGTSLRILGLSMAGVGPSMAGVRGLKTLSV